jgi:hypothetical protein
MTTDSIRRVLTLLLVCLIGAGTADAQTRFEAGPVVALYAPRGSFDPVLYYSTALPNSPGDLSGLALGAVGRVWVGGRVGFQLEGSVAFSHVGGGATPVGMASTNSARVFTGSAQVLLRLTPAAGPVRLWLGAGAGVVSYGGDAFASYQGGTEPAGVVGVGSTVPIGPSVDLNLGVSTLLYSLSVRDSVGTEMLSGSQVDLQLRTGVTWHWH